MLSFKTLQIGCTLCIFLFALTLPGHGQTDTRFWFAPPDISNEHDESDNYIELRLANADVSPVTVSIVQPDNAAGINRTITIQPDQSQTISFNNQKTLLETTEGGVKSTGLLITSTGPITAYYEVGRASSVTGNNIPDKNGEIFTLKGSNALGTRFYTPFQNFYRRYTSMLGNTFSDAHSSFDIVATENNTRVTFTLTRPGVNGTTPYPANTPHSVTLNRGETYTVRAAGDNALDRMTGSLITSTRPIAVTMKDDSPQVTWSTGADLIGDQLVPTNVIGTNYIVVRGYLGDEVSNANQFNQNKVVIVATEPGTNITIDNRIVATNLAAGAFYVHTIPGTADNPALGFSQNISSNEGKPVYVYSVSGYGGEMGGPLLPPVQCTGSSRVDFVRSNADPFFLTIIALPQALDSFYVENRRGIVTRADFTYTTGGWYVAQMRMDATPTVVSRTGIPLNTAITVRNTGGYFHLGIINGTTVDGTSRFGYFSDFGKNTSALPVTASNCPGVPVMLDSKILALTSVNWYRLPDRTTVVSTRPVLSTAVPGSYYVELNDTRGCLFTDTVGVQNFPVTTLSLGKTLDTVCFNVSEPIVVNVANTSEITWRSPAGVAIPPNTRSWNPRVSGNYIVNLKDDFGCSQGDTIGIAYSDSLANFSLQPSQKTVCFNVKNPIVVPGGPYRSITWTAPETVPLNAVSHNPATDGVYTVRVENRYRCFNTGSVQINYDNDLFPFNLGPDTLNVCSYEGLINVPGSGYDSIKWQGPVAVPAGTTSFKPTKSGEYIVKVVNPSGCFAMDTVQIQYAGDIALNLGGDSAVSCETRRTVLTAVAGNYRYTWRDQNGIVATGTSTYQPTTDGRYSVRVEDSIYNYCFAEDAIYVSFPDTIQLNFEGDSAVSCFGAGFRLCAGSGYSSYTWTPASLVPPSTQECYSPTQSGRYSLTVTDRFGCRKSDSVFVKYYDKPDLGLNGADTATCYPYTNSYVIRLPAGNATYEWSPGVTTDSVYNPTYQGKDSQKFVVKVTNRDGCTATDSVTVHFIPEIKFSNIVGGDTTACQYARYTIRAGGGFARYVWVNNVAGEQDSIFVPTSSGKYYVTVYTARGGCRKTSDTSNVKFVSDRVLTIEGRGTICSGDSVDLVATSDFETYKWMDNPLFDKQIYAPAFPDVVAGSRIFPIKVEAGYEKVCKQTAVRDIVFIRKNNFDLGNDTTVCPGTTIVMDAGPGYTSYRWVTNQNPGLVLSTKQVISVTKPGFYIVNLTSDCGLDSPGRIISYFAQPDATISYSTSDNPGTIKYGNVANVCYTDMASLTTQNTFQTYSWKQSGVLQTLSTTNQLTVNEDGLFYVTVTDSNTCADVDSITVVTNDSCFFVPNLVTPNDDQQNDLFEVKGIKKNTWYLEVYNRWGDRVYLSKGYNNDWNPSEIGDGVYYYYLTHPVDDRKYKGWLQVLSKK